MIIAISGPSSTGKTTLINKIKEKGNIGKYSNNNLKLIYINKECEK